MSGIALITGAAQGIGRAVACRLAKDGFRVAVSDLPSKKAELEELQREISSSGKDSLSCFANVSDESEVKAMMSTVVNKMGGLDVLVANAGICNVDLLVDAKREDLERLFSVNVYGSFFCYKHAAIEMIKQGKGGRIIGASSVGGKRGAAFLSGYCATKFAIRGLTQTAATELGPYGITVNAYAPGTVDTPMIHALRAGIKERLGEDPSQAKRPIENDIPPEDIAGLVSYLSSKEAALVTGERSVKAFRHTLRVQLMPGQTLSINGGMFYD